MRINDMLTREELLIFDNICDYCGKALPAGTIAVTTNGFVFCDYNCMYNFFEGLYQDSDDFGYTFDH